MRAEVVLPWPPTVNSIWRRGQGRTYRRPSYMAWREAAEAALYGLAAEEPYAGRVSVECRLYAPSRRVYDVDNRAKAICDILEGTLLVNDSQIDRLVMRRGHHHKPAGAVWVLVEAMDAGVCPRLPS